MILSPVWSHFGNWHTGVLLFKDSEQGFEMGLEGSCQSFDMGNKRIIIPDST